MAFIANEYGLPDLDSCKLPLHCIDPWQTHDLLWADRLNGAISSWLFFNSTNTPFTGFSSVSGLLLFERFNPWGGKFADGYSTKLFNFFRQIAFTGFASNYYCSGKTSSEYTALVDDFFDNNPKPNFDFDSSLRITLPANNLVLNLSYFYLETNFNMAIPHLFRLVYTPCYQSDFGKIFSLKFESFFCNGQKIELNTDYLLIASLVLDFVEDWTESDKEFILNQIPEHYLYIFLDSLLEDLLNTIYSSFNFAKRAVTKINYGIDYTVKLKHGLYAINKVVDYLEIDFTFDNNSHTVSDLQNIPEWYYYASLLYANNNYWHNYDFNELTDLGKPLFIRIIDNPNNQYSQSTIQHFSWRPETFGGSYTPNGITFSEIPFCNSSNASPNNTITIDHRSGFTQPVTALISEQQASNQPIEQIIAQNPANFPNRILRREIEFFESEPRLGTVTQTTNKKIIKQVKYRTGYAPEDNFTNDRFQLNKALKLTFDLSNYAINFTNHGGLFSGGKIPYFDLVIGHHLKNHANNSGELEYFVYQNCWLHDNALGAIPQNFNQNKAVIGTTNISFQTLSNPDCQGGQQLFNPPPYTCYSPEETLSTTTLYKCRSNDTLFTPTYSDLSYSGSLTGTLTYTIGQISDFNYQTGTSDKSTLYDWLFLQFTACNMLCPDLADLKKQVDEIHKALEAGKYAYLDGSDEEPRVANLGYYVERIARVLGISVNSNGSIRSIRQSAWIPQGEPIPAGWSVGQWSRNSGGSSEGQTGGSANEQRDGLAYDVRSNKFTFDKFSGAPTQIVEGGYALVENIPQLLEVIMSDLDKSLGLGDASVNVIPSPDGRTIAEYQGMNQVLTDIAFMLSQLSRNIQGGHISSLINQALLQELLSALGLPINYKELEIGVDAEGSAKIPYPAIAPGSPTLIDYYVWILQNVGLLIGNQIQPVIQEEKK